MIIYYQSGNYDFDVFSNVLGMFHKLGNNVNVRFTKEELKNRKYAPYVMEMARWCDTHEYKLTYLGEFVYAVYEDDEPLALEDFSYEMLKTLEIKLKEMLKNKRK